MRAVTMARTSSADSESSLEDQERDLKAYCAREGFLHVAHLVDSGVSGADATRPALMRLREMVEDGAVDVVVAAKVDRLARKAWILGELRDWLTERGVSLRFLDHSADGSPAGNLMTTVLGGMAEFERDRIRERMGAGLRAKAESGRFPCWLTVYGYRQISVAQAEVLPEYAGRDGEVEIEPEEAEIVRSLFSRYAAGASLPELARWMNSIGATHRRDGVMWVPTHIASILHNSLYVGRGVYGKRKTKRLTEKTDAGKVRVKRLPAPPERWIEWPAPPIVDETTWQLVQDRFEANRANLSGRPSIVYPFAGVVFCGVCRGKRGGPLRAYSNRVPRSRCARYICQSNTRPDLEYCGASVYADVIHSAALATLRRAVEPGHLAALARRAYEREQARSGSPGVDLAEAKATLKALDTQEDELLRLRLEGFSTEALRRSLETLNRKRDRAARALSEAQERVAILRNPTEATAAAEELAAWLRDRIGRLETDPMLFREVARRAFTVTIWPDKNPQIRLKLG